MEGERNTGSNLNHMVEDDKDDNVEMDTTRERQTFEPFIGRVLERAPERGIKPRNDDHKEGYPHTRHIFPYHMVKVESRKGGPSRTCICTPVQGLGHAY